MGACSLGLPPQKILPLPDPPPPMGPPVNNYWGGYGMKPEGSPPPPPPLCLPQFGSVDPLAPGRHTPCRRPLCPASQDAEAFDRVFCDLLHNAHHTYIEFPISRKRGIGLGLGSEYVKKWMARCVWGCEHGALDDRPKDRLRIAIFGHRIGHNTGSMARNHTELVSGDSHLFYGRFELRVRRATDHWAQPPCEAYNGDIEGP